MRAYKDVLNLERTRVSKALFEQTNFPPICEYVPAIYIKFHETVRVMPGVNLYTLHSLNLVRSFSLVHYLLVGALLSDISK